MAHLTTETMPVSGARVPIPGSVFDSTIQQLIMIESGVHYAELPPAGLKPFVASEADSQVLLSAPHGARTHRRSSDEEWHEEDEYTAAIALLLAQICGTSVIATTWCTDECDPNHDDDAKKQYKARLAEIVGRRHVRFVLDLHGAKENNKSMGDSLVDLGTRKEARSMDGYTRDQLKTLIDQRFRDGATSIDKLPALFDGTITAFCQQDLKVQAVQIEMKPAVRIPFRRTDASAFAEAGQYSAALGDVRGMIDVLCRFIAYLEAHIEG